MKKFYIAVDFFGWAQDATMEGAYAKRADDSPVISMVTVYEVTGDPDMLYSIRYFVPQIEGAKRVLVRYEDEDGNWQKDYDPRGTVQMSDKGQLEVA